MGLSASQARLLSITARLTDNEYHSQQIANAKMRLAGAQNDARTDYQNALNSTMLVYNGFDTEGNATSTTFTPNVIYQYQPLKNQYALLNTAGQVLVTNTDAKNYAETDNLADFLDRYGVLEKSAVTELKYKDEEVKVKNPKYDEDWDDYNKIIQEHKDSEPDKYIKGIGTPEWDERVHSSSLYQAIMRTGCMSGALSGSDCYTHVLANIVGIGKHTTSDGNEYEVYGNPCVHGKSWDWDTARNPISEDLRDQLKALHPNDHTTEHSIEDVDIYYGGTVYKDVHTERLSICDTAKNVYQEVVDFLYIIGQGGCGYSNAELLAQFFHFLEFDLDEAEIVHHDATEGDDIINPGWEEWNKWVAPPEPTTPEYLIEKVQVPYTVTNWNMELNDLEKAQWYTNLWYKMNGQDEPDRIQIKEGVEDNTDYYRKYILDALDVAKNEFTQAYQVLDVNLASSSTWLQDVLSQGIVVMQRVNNDKTNPQYKYNWTDIIYTDASELTQEQDEVAVSRAEVAYEEKMKEIEAKDKRYQLELNKLDSEHNALQTQIDSIRSEISKNVERSFKAFS